MSSVEEEPEPPGTEAALAQLQSQLLSQNSQNDSIDGSAPASQETESRDNDSTEVNSSFEKRTSRERERRSRSHKDRSSRHGKSHRKHHSSRHSKRSSRAEVVYDDESFYMASEDKTTSVSMMEDKEAEDGEILEDGEIASDDEDEPLAGINTRRSLEDNDEDNSEGDQAMGDYPDQPTRSEDTKEKTPRGKRENKRKRKDRRKDKDEKRKKARRHDYIDHDRVEEDEGGRWPGYQGGPEDDYDYGMGRRRDPRGMYFYNGSGDSPPGLYDSPSDESDEEVPSQPSLTSLVSGDFVDASVEANENEHMKIKIPKAARDKKRGGRGRRKEAGGRHLEPPKKKLIEIPMAERPVCKFYKDGKCAKGANCPFNHDIQRPKRLECCKYHLVGAGCIKGDNCIYMHEDFPCKYFHTGQTCYAAEKCRFSHEPLTEETRKIIEEITNPSLKEDAMDSDRPKKPSLLGTPPRHILAAAGRAKEIKKIPSLFDIEVFPPGQKPKPVSFYSERGDSSSPPPDGSPTRPAQNTAPVSSSPSPSLLGTPPQNNMRGPNPGGMMQQGPNPMMMAGAQGPMNRPMMGAQRPMFGMQQGMNSNMPQGMNPNMPQGMNSNMPQQGMNPNMPQQGMNPNMPQQGMNPNMPQQGMNPNMPQQGMNPNMPQQGMNPNMPQGMNPNMPQQGMNNMQQQGMNTNMPQQGMNTNMPQQGMNTNMPQQGMNTNMQQQGMNTNMPQGMNPSMPQQGMNPNMPQQGMNTSMPQQGMNSSMQQQGIVSNVSQSMNTNMNPGMNSSMMQQGMGPRMQGMGMNQGMNSNMEQNANQGMNQNVQNMPQGMNQNMQGMQQRMQNPGMNSGIQQGVNPNMPPQGMNMNQQGMNPMQGMMNQQGMNPNMRGMNPNMMQRMNRMMNPNMPGMAAPRFGMGAQTASAMPPVLNMISALLRGTGPGPFNQASPQGTVPNQGPMMPQDSDMRTTGDTDMRNSADGSSQADAKMSDNMANDRLSENSQVPSDGNASNLDGDNDTVSTPAQPAQDPNLDGPGGEEKTVLPQQNSEASKTVLCDKEESGGESSDEEGMSALTIAKGSPSPPPESELSSDNANKEERDDESGGDKDEGIDIAKHLPPMQRQLFMRIRQQQLQHDQQQQQQKEEAMETDESPAAEEKAAENKTKMMEDDDWYSSDEDETGVSKKKLADILKTVSKTTLSSATSGSAATTTPASASSSTSGSTINVMQMIQSIRSQALTTQQSSSTSQDLNTPAPSASPSAPSSKDPRQEPADLRSVRSESTAASSEYSPMSPPPEASSSVPLPVLPTLFVDPPVTDGRPKKTLVYRMTPLSVRAIKPYWTLPPTVDPEDAERKKDPRIQAHFALVEKRGPELKNAAAPAKVTDPRLSRKTSICAEEGGGTSPRPADPRVRRSGGKDPRMGPQDPRSQNLGPQDSRSLNMGMPRQDPRMQNVAGQEQWTGSNMSGGGMMGPDARMMGPGAGGMNMMQGPNNMGQGFQGNMMQGPRGVMPGQGDMWNSPMRMGSPMGMQQGPMGMQQGPMGMQQGPMGMQQGPMNMQGGPMGMSQGPMQGGMMNVSMRGPIGMKDPRRGAMNMQGPMGMQQGNMNMPQGNMGMQQGNVGMQQGNMGMQQGNMGMQQGNMGMQQGNMGMQQGNMGMQQGNTGMQQGNTDMQQGQVNQKDPRQAMGGNVDPRQASAMQRGNSDPRQRGGQIARDPRENKLTAADPRLSRIGQDSPHNSPPRVSLRCNDQSVSPSHQQVVDDPTMSRTDSVASIASSRTSDSVIKDVDSTGSFALPPALRERELPSRSEPDPGASDDGSACEDGVATKKRFDYRNDPRFKRKRVTEKVEKTEPTEEIEEGKGKKFMGQRKSSMEYASPLGGGDDIETSGSGYGSYSRPLQSRQDPRKRKTPVSSSEEKPFELPHMELPPSLSKQPPPLPENVVLPEMLQEEPEQQLKDLFKTIDPTASPFC